MLTFIMRLVAFVAAVALCADALLPTRSEVVRVDRHELSEHTRYHHFHTHTRTSYVLHFSGGRIASCSVGSSAYGQVRDGDEVTVAESRVLRSCERITRDGVVVDGSIGRWIALFLAALALAVAFGWITPNRRDDDDDDDRPLRRGRWWLRY